MHGGGPCIVDATGLMIRGPVVVIEPGRRHAVHGGRDHAVVVHVEPESPGGRELLRRQPPGELGPGHPVAAITEALTPARWADINEAVHRSLALGGAATSPEVPSWWHRPAITDALLPPASGPDGDEADVLAIGVALGESAVEVRRSFDADLGMSVGVAMRWRRLMFALQQLADGATVGDAAHRSGYPDTRQFELHFASILGASAKITAPTSSWFH